ncbi:transcriptional regulator, partial [Pedobacter sp. Du54]
IPHFTYGAKEACKILNALPSEKLILLDKNIPGIEGNYSAVYENFEKDIYTALVEAKEVLGKYHTLKIIFPKESYLPKEILYGFTRFCIQFSINYNIVSAVEYNQIRKGDAYINLMEDDLITLIDNITSLNYVLGRDIGLISYNETPIKRILLSGITTISTNFKQMGEMAAKVIAESHTMQLEIPFQLKLRESL